MANQIQKHKQNSNFGKMKEYFRLTKKTFKSPFLDQQLQIIEEVSID